MNSGCAIAFIVAALMLVTECSAACLYGDSEDVQQARLWRAVCHGEASSIAKAIKRGANPNTRAKSNYLLGHTPLTWAIEIAEPEDDIRVIQALLANRAGVDLLDGDRKTPLMRAVHGNNSAVVRVLVAHGVVVDAVNDFGSTPLQHAAHNGYAQVVKILLDARAEVNKKNSAGRDALMCAILNNHGSLVMDFIEAGAWWDPDEINEKTGMSGELVRVCRMMQARPFLGEQDWNQSSLVARLQKRLQEPLIVLIWSYVHEKDADELLNARVKKRREKERRDNEQRRVSKTKSANFLMCFGIE